MFEKALRLKLRFETNRGDLTVEDLWDLALNDLNTIAKRTNKLLREEDEESFIPNKVTRKKATYNDLRLEILKHIINVRVEEEDKKKNRAERQAKIAQLRELATAKATEQLASQSLEDINRQLEELMKDED